MTERKKRASSVLPGDSEFRNTQLDLFQNFLCNTEKEQAQLSNTIDLWDSIPRYSISRQAMAKLRTADGFLDLHEIAFTYKGNRLKVIIQPARIREADGSSLDYYPSASEELVEDALRKLATEQQRGFFDKENFRSGVIFSLYMLREELKRRGHARSYQEIMRSLQILSGSLIEIRADEGGDIEAFSRTNYLPVLTAVSRKRLSENPEAKWVAQFHPLVTHSIDALTYRQFNYHRMMAHNTQLARWLHKQLSLKFTFASPTSTFNMFYRTIKRDSALVNYKRERDGIEAVTNAFEELRMQNVLQNISREEILGPRGRIEDVKYTLHATMDFVRETKAANKRLATAVDNSDSQGKSR
jgi:hypothetical protein